jgi:carboxynorspermidine decarboxylase
MLNPDSVPSPCFVIDTQKLLENAKILKEVAHKSRASILLALKGFAAFSTFDIIKPYLSGVSASGLWEATLGRETFNKEVHTYCPAYREAEIKKIIEISDHIIFNSLNQVKQFKELILSSKNSTRFGIRINPEISLAKVALYDPCAPGSRLGIPLNQTDKIDKSLISGIHFHALCEQGAEELTAILDILEQKAKHLIEKMDWINFGGGHLITKATYNRTLLIEKILKFSKDYNIKVYIEPGEAVALNAGVLIATVLDIVQNQMNIAILDISATCHMPDVLEMPYRPEIEGAKKPGELPFTYRLGGVSCLAGDIIGDYSFKNPLKRGDKLIFKDMAHYTMVKTTMFNGVQHPSIALFNSQNQTIKIVKEFSFNDFKNRLS